MCSLFIMLTKTSRQHNTDIFSAFDVYMVNLLVYFCLLTQTQSNFSGAQWRNKLEEPKQREDERNWEIFDKSA